MLVLLASVDRTCLDADGTPIPKSSSGSAIRFYVLHAFNRLLETFPIIAGTFVGLVVEQCTRDLFGVVESAPSSSASSPSSATAEEAVEPTYGIKLLETLGLVVATLPNQVVGQGHIFLLKSLQTIHSSLADIESFEPAVPSSSSDGKKALPPSQDPKHTFVLALLDFAANVLKKLHTKLPVAFPSSRMLHPRSWPFGSEELGGNGDGDKDEEDGADEQEQKDQDAIDEEDDDEDDDSNSNSSSAPWVSKPRSCFTEVLEFNPVRRGATAMSIEPSAASELFTQLFERLRVLFEKIGRESEVSSSPGAINDAGITLLTFMPYLSALDNIYGQHDADHHGVMIGDQSQWILRQLQELDFTTFTPVLASSSQLLFHSLQRTLEFCDRQPCVDEMMPIYTGLTNVLSDAAVAFPRAQLLKLRRWAVSGFLSILYVFDGEFQEQVGTQSFFEELFKLLANPLITSHLIWILRSHSSHVRTKVLPLVMRGLLHTNTRSSPSMKTVTMILNSIGNVACFSRAIEDGSAPKVKKEATLPLLQSYMPAILETIINTVQKSPSGTGQVGSLVLCRIVMAGYDMVS